MNKFIIKCRIVNLLNFNAAPVKKMKNEAEISKEGENEDETDEAQEPVKENDEKDDEEKNDEENTEENDEETDSKQCKWTKSVVMYINCLNASIPFFCF